MTRDVRFANTVLASMDLEARPGLVILIREQKLIRVEQAWLGFLRGPREIRGIAVLSAERVRYHHAPPAG